MEIGEIFLYSFACGCGTAVLIALFRTITALFSEEKE
jgi:hypothetical protein